jgi:hypothetical protein
VNREHRGRAAPVEREEITAEHGRQLRRPAFVVDVASGAREVFSHVVGQARG